MGLGRGCAGGREGSRLALDTLYKRQQPRTSHQLDGLSFGECPGLGREIAGGHDDDGGGLMVRLQTVLFAHDGCAHTLGAPVLALDQGHLAVASQYQVDPAVRASLTRFLDLVTLSSIGLRNQLLKLAPTHGPKGVEARLGLQQLLPLLLAEK